VKMMGIGHEARVKMGLSGRAKVKKNYDEKIVVNVLEKTVKEIETLNLHINQ